MEEFDLKREVTDKYSLRGRVFTKIREDILNGRYKDHEELKEIRIGKELGVSRTPVREALRQLELEGLVQIIPNRGAFVTGIQAKDVKDISMIRARLEALCARWATEKITREQLEAMEENFRCYTLDAAGIALDLGSAKCMNIVLFGAMTKALNLDDIDWEEVIRETVPPRFLELNIAAYKAGRDAVKLN